ncbi:MAG TPA: tetratricopeptide repeat protein [Kofleriaceae bacterium]|jgi:Tfp pilus assembly protein PilF|nr:tetratricopeptide repeat protein [Kofleriaceae bacterium]
MRVNALILLVFSAGCALLPDHSHDQKKSQDRLDMAKEYLRKHELEAAESECDKALSFNHDNDEAYLVRGLVAMVRTIDTQRTMEIESCLTGIDRDVTEKDLDQALAKADLDFERAVKVTPEYGEAWADRGVVHSLEEDYSTATTYFQKALEFPMRLDNPALIRAHLGWALFHENNFVQAAKELREARQFQPKMCVATYRLARVYFARQEWEKAAELFQTASDDPSCGSQEASYYLMKTRLQQGLMVEAKVARDACLKLSPHSCIASQCRADGQALGH